MKKYTGKFFEDLIYELIPEIEKYKGYIFTDEVDDDIVVDVGALNDIEFGLTAIRIGIEYNWHMIVGFDKTTDKFLFDFYGGSQSIWVEKWFDTLNELKSWVKNNRKNILKCF